MRSATRPLLQTARARIRASRNTIYGTRRSLTRNDYVVQHMTVSCQTGLHDIVDDDSARAMLSALTVEHSTAQVEFSRQLLCIADELIETSRRRNRRRAA